MEITIRCLADEREVVMYTSMGTLSEIPERVRKWSLVSPDITRVQVDILMLDRTAGEGEV